MQRFSNITAQQWKKKKEEEEKHYIRFPKWIVYCEIFHFILLLKTAAWLYSFSSLDVL